MKKIYTLLSLCFIFTNTFASEMNLRNHNMKLIEVDEKIGYLIIDAYQAGDIKQVFCLINVLPKNSRITNLLLKKFCRYGAIEIVKYLIEERHADIEYAFNSTENITEDFIPPAAFSHLDIAIYFIKKRNDINSSYKDGNTALHYACATDNLGLVKFLTKENANIKAMNDSRQTPLNVASIKGSFNAYKYLVEKYHVKINDIDNDMKNLLYVARNENRLDIVKYLVEKYNDIDKILDEDRNTALHYACAKDNLDLVKYLTKKHANIESRNKYYHTPLHIASKFGSFNSFKYLIEKFNANTNAIDNEQHTLLHLACNKGGCLDIVKYLIEKCNANPEATDSVGYTPLHTAFFHNQHIILEYLIIKKPSLISIPYGNGIYPLGLIDNYPIWYIKTLLHLIKKTEFELREEYLGNYSALKEVTITLLQLGVNSSSRFIEKIINNCYSELKTLNRFDSVKNFFSLLVDSQYLDTDKTLLEKFNLTKNDLIELIYSYNWKKIKAIQTKQLNQEADQRYQYISEFFSSEDKNQYISIFFTPIEILNIIKDINESDKYTSKSPNLKEFLKIISREFNLESLKDDEGNNLLHLIGNSNIYSFITSINPALIAMKNNKGTLPFNELWWENLLVGDDKAYLEFKGSDGCTELHLACMKGDLGKAKFLIENHNANPYARNKEGDTPLHLAFKEGHIEIAEYLIEKNPKLLKIRNKKHSLPIELITDINDLNPILYLIKKIGLEIDESFIWRLLRKCDKPILSDKIYLKFKDPNVCTELHLACIQGDLNEVKYLVEKCHASTEALDYEKDTPLHLACKEGHLEVAKYLIEKNPKLLDFYNSYDIYPLGYIKDIQNIIALLCFIKTKGFPIQKANLYNWYYNEEIKKLISILNIRIGSEYRNALAKINEWGRFV